MSTLDTLYSLRRNFSIIGITGRTGSGCTKLAERLSLQNENGNILSKLTIRKPENIPNSSFQKKYGICYNFIKLNWQSYEIIEYKNVILFLLIQKTIESELNQLLVEYFNPPKDAEKRVNHEDLYTELKDAYDTNHGLVSKIKLLPDINSSFGDERLVELDEIFFGKEFKQFSSSINKILVKHGYVERTRFLHFVAGNLRKCGSPFSCQPSEVSTSHIYTIAEAINRIIKSRKRSKKSKGEPCHITIDSLRNSLEIMFFKERYSAFYMVSVTAERRRERILNRLQGVNEEEKEIVTNELLKIDDQEYACNDFKNGKFYAPDVQNCIQISDIHFHNSNAALIGLSSDVIKEQDKFIQEWMHNSFFTLDEQIIKFQSLIQQPGIITPSAQERTMQIAYNAKVNSGCISRQVGAVIADKNFSVKSIGWNDVPKGATPCNLRNVKDLISEEGKKDDSFSDFERGEALLEYENDSTSSKLEPDKDKSSLEFYSYVKEQYSEIKMPVSALEGRNCPYCFKFTYNKLKGDSNQVHTRSLHAEENAMMQISKYGGQPLEGGILFTTASPCELCSKKAYQLGVKTIYYIDPYPGISRSHILKSNPANNPRMLLFAGAVGRAYHKLYEPFMPLKDELTLLTGLKLDTPKKKESKAEGLANLLKNVLEKEVSTNTDLIGALEGSDDKEALLLKILQKGLKKEDSDSTNL